MFGRKARRIEELETENAVLKREIRELKSKLNSDNAKPAAKQAAWPIVRKRPMPSPPPPKKKKPSAIVGRRDVSTPISRSDDGPGFGTGLVAGVVLSNLLSDDDHHSHQSHDDNFSGGGGEFGGGGASGGWDSGGGDSGGGSDFGGGGGSD